MTAVDQCVSPYVGKRVRIVIASLLIGALGTVAWLLLLPPEPIYNAKPVSYWIASSGSYYAGGAFPLLSTDSNAVPYLVKALNRQESPLTKPYVRLWFWLPFKIQQHLPQPVNAVKIRCSAAMSLGTMQAVAKPAIPALIRAMKEDKSDEVRGWSAWSLGRLGNQEEWSSGQLSNQREIVTAALTDALNDNTASVRVRAARALELFGHAATNAIPVLKKCADDENSEVSAAAVSALWIIKPHRKSNER
jgi:HEAT repeat protein